MPYRPPMHEHSQAEVAILLTQYLVKHRRVDIQQARKMVDASDRSIYYALTKIERVLMVYKDRREWVLLDDE